jgi:hypothetical protein
MNLHLNPPSKLRLRLPNNNTTPTHKHLIPNSHPLSRGNNSVAEKPGRNKGRRGFYTSQYKWYFGFLISCLTWSLNLDRSSTTLAKTGIACFPTSFRRGSKISFEYGGYDPSTIEAHKGIKGLQLGSAGCEGQRTDGIGILEREERWGEYLQARYWLEGFDSHKSSQWNPASWRILRICLFQ